MLGIMQRSCFPCLMLFLSAVHTHAQQASPHAAVKIEGCFTAHILAGQGDRLLRLEGEHNALLEAAQLIYARAAS